MRKNQKSICQLCNRAPSQMLFSIMALGKVFSQEKPSQIILVAPNKLLRKLAWAVAELKRTATCEIKIVEIPDGEQAKDWGVLRKLLEGFFSFGLNKSGIVIALGGGTASDLVGLACSLYQRGIRYVNVPTTILAQVDASIGGKTAIDFSSYKNQIGSFHPPVAIVVDSRFVASLRRKQIVDGFAEIIKAGLIRDPKILKIMSSHSFDELMKKHIEELVSRAIKVKERFVGQDPKDRGVRQTLNFGHTIAHSFELKYGLSHGEAVLIGMIEELKIGEKLGKTNPKVRQALETLLKHLGISQSKKKLQIDLQSFSHDKKVVGDKIVLPVVKKLGSAELVEIRLSDLVSLI